MEERTIGSMVLEDNNGEIVRYNYIPLTTSQIQGKVVTYNCIKTIWKEQNFLERLLGCQIIIKEYYSDEYLIHQEEDLKWFSY